MRLSSNLKAVPINWVPQAQLKVRSGKDWPDQWDIRSWAFSLSVDRDTVAEMMNYIHFCTTLVGNRLPWELFGTTFKEVGSAPNNKQMLQSLALTSSWCCQQAGLKIRPTLLQQCIMANEESSSGSIYKNKSTEGQRLSIFFTGGSCVI